jgi:CO/xanthine dehydrogenase Mo-binding subunit
LGKGKILKDDVTSNIGDASAALAASGKKLSASYDFAIHTHGSIGPSCAIAEFTDGKLTVWSASQATHNLRKQLAKMFSMALGECPLVCTEKPKPGRSDDEVHRGWRAI